MLRLKFLTSKKLIIDGVNIDNEIGKIKADYHVSKTVYNREISFLSPRFFSCFFVFVFTWTPNTQILDFRPLNF